MRITVYGKGNVGGGLGDLWEQAGHQVDRLGHEGGDVSNAEVVLLAVPGGAVSEAIGKLRGAAGKMFIDATNRFGVEPPEGFTSNVKSVTNGPTAKAFSLNFAALYPFLVKARSKPSNIWSGDPETREVVELLTADAGYDPVFAGDLTKAAAQEAAMALWASIAKQNGPLVYRLSKPQDL
jgi:predicted dinucleotide-binding enzyme